MAGDPIKFFASIESLNAGDEEIRLVLFVKDTPVDLAAAVTMLGNLNRVLRVSAYLGTGAEALAEFSACIAQMKTGIQFRKDKLPVIRLDIPASHSLQALRLVGYSEKLVRFEVEDEGERARSGRKAQQKPKEPKGPYSYFWEFIHNSGFLTYPGVFELLEKYRRTPTEDPWKDLLHRIFGVETMAFISPEEVLEKFPDTQQVKLAVERGKKFQAEKFQSEKEAKSDAKG